MPGRPPHGWRRPHRRRSPPSGRGRCVASNATMSAPARRDGARPRRATAVMYGRSRVLAFDGPTIGTRRERGPRADARRPRCARRRPRRPAAARAIAAIDPRVVQSGARPQPAPRRSDRRAGRSSETHQRSSPGAIPALAIGEQQCPAAPDRTAARPPRHRWPPRSPPARAVAKDGLENAPPQSATEGAARRALLRRPARRSGRRRAARSATGMRRRAPPARRRRSGRDRSRRA